MTRMEIQKETKSGPFKPAWQIKKKAGGRMKSSHETAFSDLTMEEHDCR